MTNKLPISDQQLRDFCRKHHIARLSFFGSVVRDDFSADSDVDVLVEFDPQHTPGWEIVDIEAEFSRLCDGRKVEFLNPKYLHPALRSPVLDSAEVQYARPG